MKGAKRLLQGVLYTGAAGMMATACDSDAAPTPLADVQETARPGMHELVENGGFSEGLNHWTEYYSGHTAGQDPIFENGDIGLDVRTVNITLDVVDDYTMSTSPVLEVGTELDGPSLGRSSGVKQRIEADVSKYGTLVLSFNVRPMHANIPLAGGEGIENAGVTLYGSSNGKPWSRDVGVVYEDTERDDQITFYMDRWGPDALRNKSQSTVVPRNEWYSVRVDLKDLPDAPEYIEEIRVRGKGWDYRFKIDNVSLAAWEQKLNLPDL
ncbi:MAG: hypothetical protein HY365_03625 [Candidatus Aenigmarchaeota archaeon]|nr:hypothetical protein [Candidatus Aenigmarchaeota archaeon]